MMYPPAMTSLEKENAKSCKYRVDWNVDQDYEVIQGDDRHIIDNKLAFVRHVTYLASLAYTLCILYITLRKILKVLYPATISSTCNLFDNKCVARYWNGPNRVIIPYYKVREI